MKQFHVICRFKAKMTLHFKGEITLENEIRVANNVRVVKLHFFVQDLLLQVFTGGKWFS